MSNEETPTPRTDSNIIGGIERSGPHMVFADFARTLERELVKATKRSESKHGCWMSEIKRVAKLERENAELRRQLDLERKRRGPGPFCERHNNCPMEFFGYLSPGDDSGIPGEDWRCVLCAFDSLDESCNKLHAALSREKRLREVADELAQAIPCDHALHLISKARALNAYHAALAFDGKEETPCS
jgi:hypothetical protein